VEGLGVVARAVAFHAAKAHQAQKRFAFEPMFGTLRGEGLKKKVDFVFVQGRVERHKNVGAAQVAIVLGNFVFENEVIAKGVPGKFAEQAMVLMSIALPMREDQIGIDLRLHAFEIFFDLLRAAGKKAVAIVLKDDLLIATRSKQLGGLGSFLTARAGSGENDPVQPELREKLLEMQKSPAATDFDIVRMSPKTQNREWTGVLVGKSELDHATIPAAG
jgi:hypothetical protein